MAVHNTQYIYTVLTPENYEDWEPFVNYVKVPREKGGGLERSLHTLTLGRGGQTHPHVIFSKSIYIRNRAVKWFGRDDISFAFGR